MLEHELPEGTHAAAVERKRQEALERPSVRRLHTQPDNDIPAPPQAQQSDTRSSSEQQGGTATHFTDWASI